MTKITCVSDSQLTQKLKEQHFSKEDNRLVNLVTNILHYVGTMLKNVKNKRAIISFRLEIKLIHYLNNRQLECFVGLIIVDGP
jgi:hypothetical protein